MNIKYSKVTGKIAVHKSITAIGTRMPHGITECYFSPSRGNIPVLHKWLCYGRGTARRACQ